MAMIDSRTNFLALLKELSGLELFDGYSMAQIEDLVRDSRVVYTGHREQLYRQGDEADSFGVVLTGAYKLIKTSPDGAETILHFAIAGDVIGALLMRAQYTSLPVSAVAMGPSRFLKIPKLRYLEEWATKPELLMRVQNFVVNRLSHFRDQKAMLKSPLAARVAALLLTLSDSKSKSDQNQKQEIPIPLTRKEIAETLGSSVESVIRVMSEWSKSEIISTSDQQITILNPVLLAKESQRL